VLAGGVRRSFLRKSPIGLGTEPASTRDFDNEPSRRLDLKAIKEIGQIIAFDCRWSGSKLERCDVSAPSVARTAVQLEFSPVG